jgi:4-amino-4-deoxy-L-arabinose transferase-like glycosyltransferase
MNKWILKPSDKAWVVACMVIALFLRLYRLDTDLLIHFDQGLHAYGAWQIWHEHKFKLLGHMTDTDGINHGPYFYLLLSVPYFLSGGSPVAAAFFLIFLEILSFYLLYKAIIKLFDKQTARLTLLIVSVSYGAVYFSRWLSNVTPILPLTNIALYLAISHKEKPKNLKIILLGIVSGLVAQMNGAVGLAFIPSILLLTKKPIKDWILYILAIVVVQIPLIVFDLRHDFVMVRAITTFALHSNAGLSRFGSAFIPTIISYLHQNEYYLAHGHFLIAAVLFVFGLHELYLQKKYRVSIYMLLGVFTFGMMARGGLGFFFSYLFVMMVAVCVLGLRKFDDRFSVAIAIYLVVLNLFMLRGLSTPSNGLTPIGTNSLITVQDRRNAVDFIYTKAEGEPFSLWIYTIPYFLDQPWTYFFDWYGMDKYGYLPEMTGSFSPGDLKTSKRVFVIYEPDVDNPNRLKWWLDEVESNFGPVNASYRSHDAIVELRSYEQKQ